MSSRRVLSIANAMAAMLALPIKESDTNVRLELRPPMLLPDIHLGMFDTPSHPILKKYARRPWGRGRNNFVPHWNTRECARRIVQIAKGQLTGHVAERQGRQDTTTTSTVKGNRITRTVSGPVVTRPASRFVSESAFRNADKLRLRAIGLHQYDPRVAGR